MAKIIGSLEDCVTDGERLLVRMLNEKLSDDSIVWSNVQLSGTDRNNHIYDRELDCLAYIQGLGLFIFEVKDWRIDHIKNFDGESVSLKNGKVRGNPFKGFNSRFYSVKNALDERIKNESGRIPFPINVACCFPYITRGDWDNFFKQSGNTAKDMYFQPNRALCADDMGMDSQSLFSWLDSSRSVKFKDSLTPRNEKEMGKIFSGGITRPSAILKYITTSDLRTSRENLRGRGGLCQKASEEMGRLIHQKSASYKLHEKPCREIQGINNGIAYAFAGSCELATLHHNGIIYPVFAGTQQDVDIWATDNQGLIIVINKETTRISLTRNTTRDKQISIGDVPAITSENKPLFERVDGFSLGNLKLGKLEKKYFSSITETTDPEEIEETLEELDDPAVARLLADMISLIRKGACEEAKAAWELCVGAATTAEADPALESAALEEDINSDLVCTLTNMDKSQFESLFDPDSFDDWVLFLHPEQKKVVKCNSEKPMLLTGVSGSGKTCILAHRARRLAQDNPTARIGILTLNRTLASFINKLVGKLCSKEELLQIRCLAYYDYFKEVIEKIGADDYLELYKSICQKEGVSKQPLYKVLRGVHPHTLVREYDHRNQEAINDTWEEALEQPDPKMVATLARLKTHLQKEYFLIDEKQYLKDELELIRTTLPIVGRRDAYFNFTRNGRAVPFWKKHREDVLYILDRFDEYMFSGGMLDTAGLTQALLCKDVSDQLQNLPASIGFDHILVDEFQDFSTAELNILRAIPKATENAFCAAGDTTQKIHPKELRMASTGLVRGSAQIFRIKKNFRNSKQILQAASELSKHYAEIARRQGVDIDFINPDLAERETAKPKAFCSENEIADAWNLASEWITNEKMKPWAVCIATADPRRLPIKKIIEQTPRGLRSEPISADIQETHPSIKVAELGDVKGFEFSLIVIVGCSSEAFPNPRLPPDEAWRDALRLYVAMTRGRDQVVLIYSGTPSHCLHLMKDTIEWNNQDHASLAIITSIDTDVLFTRLCDAVYEKRLPYKIANTKTNDVIVPANSKLTKARIHKLIENLEHLDLPEDSILAKIIKEMTGKESAQ